MALPITVKLETLTIPSGPALGVGLEGVFSKDLFGFRSLHITSSIIDESAQGGGRPLGALNSRTGYAGR